MELLNEAVDGGHRVLVFSQFTSMLAILRRRLDEQRMGFSYLDGLTKDRLRVVNEFNARRDIPIFLMSLKAGGTGLNLTGADMVIHFDPGESGGELRPPTGRIVSDRNAPFIWSS